MTAYLFKLKNASSTTASRLVTWNKISRTSPPASYLNSLISVTHGIHKIDAILPNKDQHEILKIDSTEPCLRIERFSYSEEELVSAACLLHPGFRIVLEGEFGK